MTPEEKLLALIQQEKQQPETPVTSAPTAAAQTPPAAPTPKPAPAAAVTREPAKAVEPQPVPEKKLKLAPQTAPAEPAKVASPAAAPTPPPAPAATPAPAPAPAAGEKEPVATPTLAPVPVPTPAVPTPSESRRPARAGGMLGLVFANRMLAAVVLVLLVGVVYSIASIQSDVAGRARELRDGAGVQPMAVAVVTRETPPPVEVFLDRVSVRDVFLPSGDTAMTTTVVVAQGKLADLKLVGVSLDTSKEEESVAIIRNKAESKMYFVKKGQAVGETGYTLERVLADRAILKMRKQEIELR